MMRRASRSQRRPLSARDFFRSWLAQSGGMPLLDVSSVVEDVTNPGFVLRFVDRANPARWLEQTDHAKQVAMPAAHADFGGRKCVAFTGAQVYVSNQALTFWNSFHNGACEWATTLTLTGGAGTTRIIAETTDPPGNGGAQFFLTSGNVIRHNVFRTASTAAIDVASAAIGTPQMITGIVDTGQTPNRSIKSTGNAAVTAALGGTDKDATLAFTFGGRTASLFLQARVRHLFVSSPGLTAAQRAIRNAWLLQDSGLSP